MALRSFQSTPLRSPSPQLYRNPFYPQTTVLTVSVALDRVALRSFQGRIIEEYAQVVELVDTLASGASDRKVVEVQVLFWAPLQYSL
jgi:hypothetical protein